MFGFWHLFTDELYVVINSKTEPHTDSSSFYYTSDTC